MSSLQIAGIAVAIAGAPMLWANAAIASLHGYVLAGTFYSITELPFQPADLNNFGDVVGQQYLWRSGTLTDIRTFPGTIDTSLNARGINDNGWIVGDGLRADRSTAFDQYSNNRGFIFDRSQITPIGSGSILPSTTRTVAVDVNNRNQVVVNEQYFAGTGVQGNTVRIEPDGTRTALFQGAQFGSVPATAINTAGQAVGSSVSSGRTGPGAAYLADPTNTTPLISSGYCSTLIDFIVPRCEPSVTSPPQPIANGLNDAGQVVGAGPLRRANEAPVRAVIWESPATNSIGKDLGSFGQAVSEGTNRNIESVANSINTGGEVVGYAYARTGERRAVIWQNGTLFDLNDRVALNSGWQLTSAFKINDQGQIIGTGVLNGQETGFLLAPEPVPEPNQTIAMVVGVGVMLTCHYRQYTRSKTAKSRRSERSGD